MVSDFPDRPPPPRSLIARLGSWIEWVGLARVLSAAVVVLAVVAGAYWLVKPPPVTTESKLPYAPSAGASTTTAAATAASATPATTVTVAVVHVAGAVAAPGVYRLDTGARVIDAVHAAGGLTTEANADALNLAALLTDGQRVYVPRIGETPPVVLSAGPGSTSAPAGPVNLNTATATDLESLPGVGPATAATILAHREQHGPFASVDDLADVRGIGPAKLEALRGLVTV